MKRKNVKLLQGMLLGAMLSSFAALGVGCNLATDEDITAEGAGWLFNGNVTNVCKWGETTKYSKFDGGCRFGEVLPLSNN